MASWRKSTFTILNGQTDSNEVSLIENGARRPKAATISSPAGLVQTVVVHTEIGGAFSALQSGGSDIDLPAGKNTTIDKLLGSKIKLVAGVAITGGDKAFKMEGNVVK